jgi:hypothetical protein
MTDEEGMMKKYKVRVIRRKFQQSRDDYHATVTRISDGVELMWTSSFLWLLKWRTRRRALDRWFARYDKREEKLAEVREFTR